MVVEFLMWLTLFASLTIAFCTFLLEAILHDSTAYDMEFLWKGQYTLEELHLDR
ncbi:hypothetical protein PAESOLCIP111_02792 [Paenibacillus solanacearum]|uniref:Uncharacterized protein n=1 Tax=Paenibacillus solanacearum TaxID=2048548 RepID=A0A916NXE8_9BACL|nr:hypothetical protein [Paenibacillus solanacearum]CAG7626066.1 hypothetical protein PAESOLCIP111_02792 [Paenibacillus solanacearum]